MISATPAKKSFTIWPGADFIYTLTYLSGDAGSSAVDLSGWTGTMPIKNKGGTTLMTLGIGSGLTLGGAAGTVNMHITAVETAALTWKTADYELFLTDLTSVTYILLRGTFTVHTF